MEYGAGEERSWRGNRKEREEKEGEGVREMGRDDGGIGAEVRRRLLSIACEFSDFGHLLERARPVVLRWA